MKIAYTGAHGTGKTTSVFQKASELKIMYPYKSLYILQEVARDCPLPINKDSTYSSQLWIFSSQLEREIKLTETYDILVCDRTILDNIAYFQNVCPEYYEYMFNLVKPFVKETYSEIIFKKIKDNTYLYNDGFRVVDNKFQQTIENNLIIFYEKLIAEGYLDKKVLKFE